MQNRISTYKKHKVRSIGSLLLIAWMLIGFGNQVWSNIQQDNLAKQKAEYAAKVAAAPDPKFTLLSAENTNTNSTDYELKFSIADAVSAVDSDSTHVYSKTELSKVADGTYTQTLKLYAPESTFGIVVKNEYKDKTFYVKVTRQKTAEEIQADKDAEKAALQITKDAKTAEQQTAADDLAYKRSPAGRLCTKHPDWSANDCDMVANNLYWIGMSIDMVKAERGSPDHTSTSNYGSGVQYQWCWSNYDTSCFYGDSNGIISQWN